MSDDSAHQTGGCFAAENLANSGPSMGEGVFRPSNDGGCTYSATVEDALATGYAEVQAVPVGELVTIPSSSVSTTCEGSVLGRQATDAQLDRYVLGTLPTVTTVTTSDPGLQKLVVLNPCEQPAHPTDGGSFYGSSVWATHQGACVHEFPDGMDTEPALSTKVEQQIASDFGTSTVTMPDCTNMTYDQCVAELRAAGLRGWIYDDPTNDPAPSGVAVNAVEATDPRAGTQAVWVGTDVTLETYGSQVAGAPDPGSPPTTDGGGTDGGLPAGSPFTCPTITIPAIDFAPLQGIDFGSAFPFGAVTWAQNGVTGWSSGDHTAPEITIPLLGAGQGHPVHADLSVLDDFMVIFREFVLIVVTFGLIWFLATSAFGFKEWGVGEQGQLF
jgi:hypothetical protein